MNEKPLTQPISICISIKTKFQTITPLETYMPKFSWKRNQLIRAKVIKHACIMSLSCSLAFTNVLAQQSQKKAYQMYSTKSEAC